MPHTPPGKVVIARWAPPEVTAKDHFSQHFFVGGNVFMLDILQDNVDALGLTASSDLLEKTKVRTLVQLQEQSGRLALGDLRLQGNNLTAAVTVENLTGHKFPSGFPSRRLWIHFTVRDAGGDVVFESGRPLAGGTIAGNDNDATASGYEPHHQVITDQGQVQIYESLMKDTDGNVTYTLFRASTCSKDNRLLPRGFAKETAPPAIGCTAGRWPMTIFREGAIPSSTASIPRAVRGRSRSGRTSCMPRSPTHSWKTCERTGTWTWSPGLSTWPIGPIKCPSAWPRPLRWANNEQVAQGKRAGPVEKSQRHADHSSNCVLIVSLSGGMESWH